jgi:hypothetical protein
VGARDVLLMAVIRHLWVRRIFALDTEAVRGALLVDAVKALFVKECVLSIIRMHINWR